MKENVASEHNTTQQVQYKYKWIKTYVEYSPPKATTGNVYWESGGEKGAFYSSW